MLVTVFVENAADPPREGQRNRSEIAEFPNMPRG
jgi:hypothetical protein